MWTRPDYLLPYEMCDATSAVGPLSPAEVALPCLREFSGGSSPPAARRVRLGAILEQRRPGQRPEPLYLGPRSMGTRAREECIEN